MTRAPAIVHAFSDEAGPARALAAALGIDCMFVDVHEFPDGEVLPTVPSTAETTIVYRSLARPNDKLLPLILACDAWRRAGAQRLILVSPYMCYLRQDAAFLDGQPVSQKVIGDILGERFDRIITVDPHLHRTHSISAVFPQTAASHISAAPAIADWLAMNRRNLDFVVGPDIESEPWVAQVAQALERPYRLFTKTRLGDTEVRLDLTSPHEFSGRNVALVDDICSSGGTLIEAAKRLKDAGALEITVCVTHALFSEAVGERLRAAGAATLASTDSVIHPTNAIALAALLAIEVRNALHSPRR